MDYSEIIPLAIFGFIIFGIGLYTLDRDYRAKKYGQRTRGIVIDIEEETSDDSFDDVPSPVYRLIVNFRDNRANKITKKLDFASSIPPNRKPPYKVTIYYLKEGDDYIVVLAKNIAKIIFSYAMIITGLLILIFVILEATDQLTPFKNYILNLFS